MLDQVFAFFKNQISGKGMAAILFYGSLFAITTLLVTTIAESALLFAGAFVVLQLLDLYSVLPFEMFEWYTIAGICWGFMILYKVVFKR
jgi:hypothetical protein